MVHLTDPFTKPCRYLPSRTARLIRMSCKSDSSGSGSSRARSSEPPKLPPQMFLLLENPRPTNNLGPILRCASAFGITTVVVVGYEKCSVDGAHGAHKNVAIVAFPVVEQALAFLRKTCQCQSIVGITGALPGGYGPCSLEKDNEHGTLMFGKKDTPSTTERHPRSFPVHDFMFDRANTCFAVCKSRQGLTLSLSHICHSFVHVPHSSRCSGDPHLDGPSCLSIALHEFTNAAGYDEQTFQGHKFRVERPAKRSDAHALDIKRQREKKRAREAEETEVSMAGSIFDNDSQGDY